MATSFGAPNLPGFVRNTQAAKPRPQNFTVTNGQPTERRPPQPSPIDTTARFRETASQTRSPAGDTARAAAAAAKTGALGVTAVPAEIAVEGQVLRFFAFFKEGVHESPLEAERVRKCTVYYYLADATMMIAEPREENSGIVQGTFVKRHRIPRGDAGEFYQPEDLRVGENLTVYGRVMHITDCDGFTREWYAKNGAPQPASEEVPADAYATVRARAAAARAEDAYFGKQQNPLKQFMEASLGRVTRAENLGQFLENDRKVLRFFCYWDDTSRLYGDRLVYTLHYFLSDDTVEVGEVQVPNSGRDSFPRVLRRQKLRKQWKGHMGLESSTSGVDYVPPASDFVHPEDLVVGGHLDVFGRDLEIVGCDGFTREWYRRVMGYEQPEGVDRPPVDTESKVGSRRDTKREIPIPPPTGFGGEEDSLACVTSLIPKPPKRDYAKAIAHDGKILRWSARMSNAIPEDRNRQFVIQLYLADDTLTIYEPAIRNSGIVGGKFLNRAKYRKPDGSVFSAADFVPGRQVEIFRRTFLVLDADDYTKKTMPEVGGDAPLPAAIASGAAADAIRSIRDDVMRRGSYGMRELHRAFLRFIRSNKRASLSVSDINAVLGELSITANTSAIVAVLGAPVHFSLLWRAIRGNFDHSRKALCHAAFDAVDKTGAGYLSVEELAAACDFSKQQRVVAGEVSVDQAADEFLTQWDILETPGTVTRDDFIEFSADVSATIQNDDFFRLMMSRSWRV